MMNKGFKSRTLFGGVLLLVLGFFIGTAVISSLATDHAAPVFNVAEQAAALTETEQVFASIYNQVTPSVVSIRITGQASGGLFEGAGTGFVIDQQGHIVTNSHVAGGAERIEVHFFDGTIARGDVVGLDPDSDLAVLQVDVPAERLHPVTFADSDQLTVGQMTLAIGSPFGQEWTLTSGIISALNRTIEGLTLFSIGAVIQTDAAINPGNSGGPLLNLQGQVIGVNAQIISESRSSAGVGFAIPSNLVQRVASDLIADGHVDYSYLGIGALAATGGSIDLRLIEALGLPNNLQGIVVGEVTRGGPADQAGLRNASDPVLVDGVRIPRSVDIITAIDGVPVTSMSSLISYLAAKTVPGQTVNLTVLRDGQQVNVPVTLGTRPQS